MRRTARRDASECPVVGVTAFCGLEITETALVEQSDCGGDAFADAP